MKAIVTGCHGDMGFALVNHLLEKQYHVTAIDKNLSRIKKVSTQLLTSVFMDLANVAEVQDSVKTFSEPFDLLIYVAGIREIKSATTLEAKEWNDVLNVNLNSAFFISQQLIRNSITSRHPLNIIFISSVSGLQGEPNRNAYCASKHGLIGLAKALAIELAHANIRVNVIAPGIIETEMTRPYQKDATLLNNLQEQIPLKKWGQPKHIIQTVDFLIANDYQTGSTIVVDGGWTIGKKI